MAEIKHCEYCAAEYMGSAVSKYCTDVCKGLAKVERDTGYHVDNTSDQDVETTCDGECSRLAHRFLRKRAGKWKFLTTQDFYVKTGEVILFCPYCGGQLE